MKDYEEVKPINYEELINELREEIKQLREELKELEKAFKTHRNNLVIHNC